MEKSTSASNSENGTLVNMPIMKKLQVQPCQNGLEVPVLGTVFRIVSISKKGNSKRLPIVVAPEENKFFALFDEDDVDFKVEVDNEPVKDRDLSFKLKVHNSDDSKGSFIIRKRQTGAVKTLESGGRKLHFIKQSGEEGQVCVGTFATKRGLKYEDASKLISQIGISVSYSKPGFDVCVKTGIEDNVVVHAMPAETMENLKKKICEVTGTWIRVARLLLREMRVEDLRTVADYNLDHGDKIYMYEALMGGGCGPPPKRPKDVPVGERGAIVFGGKSDQKFTPGYFHDQDDEVKVEDFVIELRMASRFAV